MPVLLSTSSMKSRTLEFWLALLTRPALLLLPPAPALTTATGHHVLPAHYNARPSAWCASFAASPAQVPRRPHLPCLVLTALGATVSTGMPASAARFLIILMIRS